jgi:hypothetical protein
LLGLFNRYAPLLRTPGSGDASVRTIFDRPSFQFTEGLIDAFYRARAMISTTSRQAVADFIESDHGAGVESEVEVGGGTKKIASSVRGTDSHLWTALLSDKLYAKYGKSVGLYLNKVVRLLSTIISSGGKRYTNLAVDYHIVWVINYIECVVLATAGVDHAAAMVHSLHTLFRTISPQ